MPPDPMYRKIAEDLRQKIESGQLGQDGSLPTELELRDQYGASRNTVRDAVKLLVTRGLIETRPGQGTFVVDKIDPFVTTLDIESGFGDRGGIAFESEVEARSRRPETTVPRIEIHPAAAVAGELMLPDGAVVVSRHQQRFIDNTPWSLQTSFYPMSLADQGAGDLLRAVDMSQGAVRYIEKALGIKQVGWRDKITVRAPDPTETAFFKLPDDGRVAVFEIRRTSFDESETPMRVTVTVYPADRNQFVMHVGRVPRDTASVPVPDPGEAAGGQATTPGPVRAGSP